MFITFEGIDGAGKSLQSKICAEELRKEGYQVTLTREPGGSKGAEELRNLVLNGKSDRWSPMSEILIFTAARRDHCEKIIWPALERGEIVICDRFVDSTRLYQGLSDEKLMLAVNAIHQIAISMEADLTLVFDMDPELAFGRMSGRGTVDMRFEAHGLDFQKDRRRGFQTLAKSYPDRFEFINADQEVKDVTLDCLKIIRQRLDNQYR